MTAWDPAHYEQFERERAQPGHDLMARIDLTAPHRIVDLGCGTGRLTGLLADRYPTADVLGIDRSSEMLSEAAGRVRYRQADIVEWEPDGPLDLIYANASLQWIPDHPRLFPRLHQMLAAGGVLAVQMPLSWDQPSHRIMRRVGEEFGVDPQAPPTLEPTAYYQLLGEAEIWVTTYYHRLSGPNPVFRWVSATGMKRFLGQIPYDGHDEFRARCARLIEEAYPAGPDGATVFPFRRLFIIDRA
ncbi:MAG: methyltransferase domain-containing protein [Acidimicrobiia bacterium]|nr:methyltransferase domain-containing protein [Acidimicrobiia bacterium]NNF11231.1 methyltransferase domain-containing protein [Acidimicrobiia bacterium]NNL68967.1 methyltransferase domain-containing protein [Acidimicrobiia bacterium]